MTPDEWRTRVGEKIQERREHLGLSKRQAAKNAGVSEIVWRQVESGKRQLSPGNFIAPTPEPLTRTKIAKALGWIPNAMDLFERGGDGSEIEIHRELYGVKDKIEDTDEILDYWVQHLRNRITVLERALGELLGMEIDTFEYGISDDVQPPRLTFSRLDELATGMAELSRRLVWLAEQQGVDLSRMTPTDAPASAAR